MGYRGNLRLVHRTRQVRVNQSGEKVVALLPPQHPARDTAAKLALNFMWVRSDQGSTNNKKKRHHPPEKVSLKVQNKPVGWGFGTNLEKKRVIFTWFWFYHHLVLAYTPPRPGLQHDTCLLYTSDAADE